MQKYQLTETERKKERKKGQIDRQIDRYKFTKTDRNRQM